MESEGNLDIILCKPFHFVNEGTKTQGSQVTPLTSHSKPILEPALLATNPQSFCKPPSHNYLTLVPCVALRPWNVSIISNF